MIQTKLPQGGTKATGRWRRALSALALAAFFCVPSAPAQYTPPYVGLTGTLTSANGMPASNYVITLSPSQVMYVGGTGIVVGNANCGTDTTGAIIGTPNPAGAAILSAVVGTGTLGAGNYYVKVTWYDAFAHQTLPSAEASVQLVSTGSITVSPPAGGAPLSAVGMDVYIGSSAGAETYQGQTSVPTATFTQSTALGQSVSAVTITVGGDFATCPAAYTFTGGGGSGASAAPICAGSGGNYALAGAAGLIGGFGYTSAPSVGVNESPIVAPSLAAVLSASPAPPLSNNTVCMVIANDAAWPIGGYSLNMTSPGGNTVPGFPQQAQFVGPGSAFNLSNGIPQWSGRVTYPVPILTLPYNHNAQSISGPLSMTNYSIYNVFSLGVGTANPAWGVDVEGAGLQGEINANGGFLVDGAGGTSGQTDCLASVNAAPYETPLQCSFYQKVAVSGVPAAQEPELNFIPGSGSGISCADNPGVSTSCTFTSSSIGPNPSTPTVAFSNGAAGSLCAGSNDGAGCVNFTTAPTSSGTGATVTFGGSYAHIFCGISWGVEASGYNWGVQMSSAAAFSISSEGSNAPDTVYYLCHQ